MIDSSSRWLNRRLKPLLSLPWTLTSRITRRKSPLQGQRGAGRKILPLSGATCWAAACWASCWNRRCSGDGRSIEPAANPGKNRPPPWFLGPSNSCSALSSWWLCILLLLQQQQLITRRHTQTCTTSSSRGWRWANFRRLNSY